MYSTLKADDDNAAKLASKNAKPFDNDDDADEIESSLVIEEQNDESCHDGDENDDESETKSQKVCNLI